MQDPSAEAEGTPQKALGEMQVALGQGLADPRAAHPHTVQFDGGGRLDGEPLLATGVHQEGEVTGAVAAETEIVAHFKMPHRQSIDQDLADELGCRQLAQAAVEGQAEHHVDTLPTQQLEFLAQAGQTHRRRIGGEELARLRLENHHAAGYAQLQRALAQTRQDSLVPEVDAVEVTDGGDAAPARGCRLCSPRSSCIARLLLRKWSIIRVPGAGQQAKRHDPAASPDALHSTARREKSRRRKPSSASIPK